MSVTFMASSMWLRAAWTVYLSMPTLLTANVAQECLPAWEIIDEASGYRMVS